MAGLFVALGSKLAAMNLGQVLSVGGTALSTIGQIQSANAQKAAADFNARQLEAAGKAEEASASLAAQEARRQKELQISRARAVGAASGGGQDYALLGDLEEDGELRALTALWEGKERAAGRYNQASATRFEGKQLKRAGIFGAATNALTQGATFYDKYAG